MIPADLAAVRDLLAGTAGFSAEEMAVAGEMAEAGLAGEYELLVAENGGVRGFACFGRAPLTARSFYLYWLCVASDAVGTGVGHALQDGVEAAVTAAGGNRLIVETSGREEYTGPRRFYRACGYEEVGRMPDFYSDGDDGVIFCKRLG